MTGIDAGTMSDPAPEGAFDPWNFRTEVAARLDPDRLVGHTVEAINGPVGTVTGASTVPDGSYLVVATGWRVFRKRRQLPAGTVHHVDHPAGRVHVDRGRDQIRAAPVVPPEAYDDPAERERLATFYARTYRSPPRP